MMNYKKVQRNFILLIIGMFSFFAFGKQEVLDLGKIEITGEIRRPNVNLVYLKKYFNKAVSEIAKKELRAFEVELLKPAKIIRKKTKKKE